MLNRCDFIGFLGGEPDIKVMTNGDKLANFSIAVTEKWKSKDGEKKESTEWINVSIFGKLADIAEKYLKKGSKVFISGKMKTRTYDKEGTTMYSTSVVLSGFDSKMIMLGGKNDSPQSTNDQGQRFGEHLSDEPTIEDMEDDLPF